MLLCKPRLLLGALLVGIAGTAGTLALHGQPAAPPPPDTFQVQLRYRITAPRDVHVAQYDAMIEHLKKQGFEFVPPLETHPRTDREDPGKNRIAGRVSSKNVLKLLDNPHVESLLLSPPDFKLPDEPDTRIKVRLELASGFPADRQLVFANQVRVLLGELGFTEALGYDHRGYTRKPHTRLVGTIASGQLEMLLKDLRREPSGWLAPVLSDLPSPLALISPVRVTEVLPDPQPPVDLPPPPPRGAEHLDKLSAELWALVSQKAEEDKIARVEIILADTPAEQEEGWRHALVAAAPSLFLEGRLGPVVTGEVRVGQTRALAALPHVSTVRLPRPPRLLVEPTMPIKADNAQTLRAAGLDELHQRGFRGKGQRIAVLDSDFSGWEELVKSKRLPVATRLVDLTTERNADLFPDAAPVDPKERGHGTQCALAAAVAAPAAELTLIRIDPSAPHQLQTIARFINGEPIRSEHIDRRQDELRTEESALRQRRAVLLKERRDIFEKFDDESRYDEDYGFLGAVGAWVYSDRQWHFRRLAEYEQDVERHRAREKRFDRFVQELLRLSGIHLVSCSLVYSDAYPLGGNSALSRWFDETPQKAMWFVSTGNTRGQAWSGLYRDADANGVMEFAPPEAPLRGGRWTHELSFLAWQPWSAEQTLDLPTGATLRLSLQWREPHDPDYFFRPDEPDVYRKPLAALRLVVLRQRDPAGKSLPADDFEVVARSGVLPERLDNFPNCATYEQSVRFRVDKPGRYALRVERQLPSRWSLLVDPPSGRHALGLLTGLMPAGIRPLGKATLPALEKSWELRPRLFVEATEGDVARSGRPVFLDYAADPGTLAMLADSRGVISVGAARLNNQPQPYSALGPPAGLDYIQRPHLFAYDALDLRLPGTSMAYGANVAAPFAAGTVAGLFSAGLSREQFAQRLQQQPGAVLTRQWAEGRRQ